VKSIIRERGATMKALDRGGALRLKRAPSDSEKGGSHDQNGAHPAPWQDGPKIGKLGLFFRRG